MAMTVAYGLLPDVERSALHRTAAERLASSASYRSGQDDAVIARHLELAGDASAAADRYLKAATHAVEVGGNADGFRQLTRVLKLLPRDDHARRFAARRQRLEILGRLTRRAEQQREIENLIKEAEALADPAKLALAYSRLAQFYIDIGKAPAASRAVAPALDYAREAGDRLGEAEALRLRASIARLVGNNDEALRLCEQALALCVAAPTGGTIEPAGPRAGREEYLQRAIILNNRGTTLWNMGRLREASESYAEALVIYRMLKLPRFEARILNNMGIIFAALGEFEEALAHYKSALKLDQKLGDRDGIALKLGNIGQTYSDLGDTARGERYLVKALKFAEQTGDRSSTTDIHTSLGQVYLQQGRYDHALAQLEQGLELATEHRDRYQEIRALIYIALAQVEAGRPAEGALELAHSATELARKMPMLVGEIYGLAVQGLALARLGRTGEAADSSAHAAALLEKDQQTEGAEQILHIHASLCEQAGRQAEAVGAIRAAHAEMTCKADKLQDPELRGLYLASKVARAIAADHARLTG
jgi:tetratricopeptide (TPR) repeat protein